MFITGGTGYRLGLVTLEQMVRALLEAGERPPRGIRIVSVPEIRTEARDAQQHSDLLDDAAQSR